MANISKKCPQCGTEYHNGEMFCTGCGSALGNAIDESMGKYCPKCGAQYEFQEQFCTNCGTALANRGQASVHLQKEAHSPIPPIATPTPTNPAYGTGTATVRSRKQQQLLIPILCCILLAVIVLVLMIFLVFRPRLEAQNSAELTTVSTEITTDETETDAEENTNADEETVEDATIDAGVPAVDDEETEAEVDDGEDDSDNDDVEDSENADAEDSNTTQEDSVATNQAIGGAADIIQGGSYVTDGTRAFYVTADAICWVSEPCGDGYYEHEGLVCDVQANYMNLYDDTIYFAKQVKNEHYLCSVDINTGEISTLLDKYTWEVHLYNNYLYFAYSDASDGAAEYAHIGRMKIGTAKLEELQSVNAWYLNVVNDYIYYLDFDSNYAIKRMNLDGTNVTTIRETSSSDICVVGNKLYFLAERKNRNKLYCMDLTTGEETLLQSMSESIWQLNYYNGHLFFTGKEDSGTQQLYEYDIASNQLVNVSDPLLGTALPNISDDGIVYSSSDSWSNYNTIHWSDLESRGYIK